MDLCTFHLPLAFLYLPWLSHIDWLIVSPFIHVDSAWAAYLSTWLWLKCMRFVERGNFWVVATRADLILLWYKAGFPSLSCRSIVYPACQPLIKKLQAPALAPASPILALLWCEPTPKPCYPRPIALRWKVPPLQLNARPWGSLSLLLSETVECLASARGDALVPDLKSETKLGNGVHLSSKPITPHSTPPHDIYPENVPWEWPRKPRYDTRLLQCMYDML